MSASLVGSEMCIRDRYKGIATIKVNITPGIAFNNTTHTGKFKIIDNSSLDTKLPNTCLLYTSPSPRD
ncbi:hypothetical protein JMUB7542_27920 [Staphylococcus aureus]